MWTWWMVEVFFLLIVLHTRSGVRKRLVPQTCLASEGTVWKKVFATQAFQSFSQTQETTLATFSGNAFQLVGFLPLGEWEEKLGGLGGTISSEVQDFVWTHPPIPWTRKSREHKNFDLQDFMMWNHIDVSMFETSHWWSCLWHEIKFTENNQKMFVCLFGVLGLHMFPVLCTRFAQEWLRCQGRKTRGGCAWSIYRRRTRVKIFCRQGL